MENIARITNNIHNQVNNLTSPIIELQQKLEKQASHIALLEEELQVTNEALLEKSHFAASLELDLEHAIYQLQKLIPASLIAAT